VRGTSYNHLYYFWTVAREGGVARAAEVLHLTPQTISSQLRVLEGSLGVRLFARKGRNLVLTDAGRLALSFADEIFRLGAEMGEALKGRSTGRPLPFSVGVVDVVPKMVAYRLLEPALHLPEPVRILCREGKLDALLADIAVHKLDMVLADTPLGGAVKVRAFNHPLGECGITFFRRPGPGGPLPGGLPPVLGGRPPAGPGPEHGPAGEPNALAGPAWRPAEDRRRVRGSGPDAGLRAGRGGPLHVPQRDRRGDRLAMRG
jgi:LysR family transcriptional regulator, transcriptional activator of nhaA